MRSRVHSYKIEVGLFSDAALELAARASLHPNGWRRVPGQQSRAAHIRTI